MAENTVSATETNRNLSASRLISRQAEESAQRQAQVIARQEASLEARDQAIAETQTGGNVNIRV